ncbi:MAG: DUF2203 domain-containing protein [Acidobacteriia bacterium]|nr:DUF2203 domain-containing protein [Terriglobia bacterium]
MPRFFTFQQALELLPQVESVIRDAIAFKSEYQEAETAWQDFQRRVMMQGGVLVDHAQLLDRKNRREVSVQHLKEALEKIQEYGCLVKDLDVGLIDFPTLLHGEEVYLCWKLGETGISFWHGVHEGFRGRKPIDREFLDNHQGERPN